MLLYSGPFDPCKRAGDIANKAQKRKYCQSKYRQGDPLGYARDHEGQIAAKIHIIIGKAQQTVDPFTVYKMEQATGHNPAVILQTGAITATHIFDGWDQQQSRVLQNAF